VIELVETEEFSGWLSNLRDSKARTRVQTRLDRLALGNPGDVKSVGPGVSEMRIDYGPGYRVYFCRRGKLVIVLLAGGDKRTQKKDIARAIALLGLMRNEDGEAKN
jgi:putative addiction module killer protein